MTPPSGSGSGKQAGAKVGEPERTLWIEKHAPQAMEELVINKKKKDEFVEIANGGGFLLLHGAPGSCKNALINAYCLQNGIKLVRHSDIKTQHLEELYGQKRAIVGFGRSAQYPDDLENLIAFIRRMANSASDQRAKPTLSAFARAGGNSFAAK